MTTHNFRIVLAQRRSMYAGRTPAPRLASAARLLSHITGIDTNRCTVIVNEGKQFSCEFRDIVQNYETLLDYGYRVLVVHREVPSFTNQHVRSNDNNVLTPTKFKRL